VPSVARAWAAPPQLSCDPGPEFQNPAPHRFIGNIQAALGQEILNVAVAQCEPEVQPNCVLDNGGREAVPAIGELIHAESLPHQVARPNSVSVTMRVWRRHPHALQRERKLLQEYRRALDRQLGNWREYPLRHITKDMVEQRHEAIGREGGRAAANNAMRTLRAIWNFALDRDETLPANPVRILKDDGWFKLPPRERSVRTDELPAFYKAVDNLPSRTARDYLLLLLFTGLRRREASGLRWDDIDFPTHVVRIPSARTKAGRKLDLPMSSFVRDLLVARRAIGHEGKWVFPADSKSGHLEEPKFPLGLVAKETGIAVSVHDLRRTFITIAEATDISPLALKALVNHAIGNDVTSGYVQMTVDRLREPAERVCRRMMELCQIKALDGAHPMSAVSVSV
jgi:integrase